MDIFDENFQCYVQARADEVIKKIEKSKKWKKLKKEYDKLYDFLYSTFLEEEKEVFNKFMSNIWNKNDIEISVLYKCRIIRWNSNEK